MCGRAIHITHWVCKKSVPFLRTDKIGYFRASNSMACPGHAVLGRVIPKTLRTTNLQSITTKCKQRLSLGRSLGKPCPRRHALRMLSLAGSVPAPCERRTYTRKHNPNIFMRWGRELSQQWSSGEFRQTKVCNQKGQKGSTGRLGRAVNPASGYVSILFSNPPCYPLLLIPCISQGKWPETVLLGGLLCLFWGSNFGQHNCCSDVEALQFGTCTSHLQVLNVVFSRSLDDLFSTRKWSDDMGLWMVALNYRYHRTKSLKASSIWWSQHWETKLPDQEKTPKTCYLIGESHYFCQLHPLAITFCMA